MVEFDLLTTYAEVMVLHGSGFCILCEHNVAWGCWFSSYQDQTLRHVPVMADFFFKTNFAEVMVLHGGELSPKILQLQMHTARRCSLLQAKTTERHSC